MRLVLRLVPQRHRDDAEQEALLAVVEGRDPIAAVDRYRKRSTRWERREVAMTDLEAYLRQSRGRPDEHA